jgi:hypothetical protein
MLKAVDMVEAVDKHTVRFTLKEPYAWFLDTLASPMVVAIVAKDSADKFGDLKKPESFVGTGPWMLDSYRPNQGLTLVRNPQYFLAGLPHVDRVEIGIDEDNASRIASFMTGKYDLGWEIHAGINRTDWVQIRDPLKQKRPGLQTAEFPSNVMSHISSGRTRSPSTTSGSARRSPTPSTGKASSTPPSRGSASTTPPSPRRSRTGRSPSPSSARARSTSSTIPPRPSGSWRRPATRTGSRRAPASRRTARRSSSTACSSCSST